MWSSIDQRTHGTRNDHRKNSQTSAFSFHSLTDLGVAAACPRSSLARPTQAHTGGCWGATREGACSRCPASPSMLHRGYRVGGGGQNETRFSMDTIQRSTARTHAHERGVRPVTGDDVRGPTEPTYTPAIHISAHAQRGTRQLRTTTGRQKG